MLLAPRTWLAIGAFSIGISMVAGYYEDQRSAEEVLHLKVSLPEEVLIQDFAPDLHMNLIRQVRVIGEIDDSAPIDINLGTDSAPRWIRAIPVYPVGPELMPIATQLHLAASNGLRRPMPRAEAEGLQRDRRIMNGLSTHAFAFVIAEPGSQPLVGGDNFAVLAEVDSRQLVSVSGNVVTGTGLLASLSESVSREGITATAETLMIEPKRGMPEYLVPSEQIQRLRTGLVFLGVAAALVALVAKHFVPLKQAARRRASELHDISARHAFPAVSFFQPIATQDELALEDDLKGDKRTGIAAAFDRLLTILQAAPRIKSLR